MTGRVESDVFERLRETLGRTGFYQLDDDSKWIGVPEPLFLPLLAVAEAAEKWRAAWERTGICHDEFGWGREGYEACAELQGHEDSCAVDLEAALAAFREAAASEVGG